MASEEQFPPGSTFLVVDLEATCEVGDHWSLSDMEIIEIGAAIVQNGIWQPIAEFQCFVRPERHPILTEFCRQLTGIGQEDVAQATTFPDAFQSFVTWMNAYQPAAWASWGDYDRKHIVQECQNYQVEYGMPEQHLNLKALFQLRQDLKRPVGMKKALELKGLEFIGTHHRALDDVKNIIQLLPFALGTDVQ